MTPTNQLPVMSMFLKKEDLIKELYKCIEDRDMLLAKAKEMAQFYADRKSQIHVSKIDQDPEVGHFVVDDFESHIGKDDYYGFLQGKKARAFLKELEVM